MQEQETENGMSAPEQARLTKEETDAARFVGVAVDEEGISQAAADKAYNQGYQDGYAAGQQEAIANVNA
jgi:flagellar biosynthesis/type III secretory pathway protein FliH